MPLIGNTVAEFSGRLRGLDERLVDGWRIKASEKTGNPLYAKPSVLVLYRAHHSFMLDSVRPKPDRGLRPDVGFAALADACVGRIQGRQSAGADGAGDSSGWSSVGGVIHWE